MLPERLAETGPCPIQERYDAADLAQLFAWRPDVDTLIEAIVALPAPETVQFRPSVAEDWRAFREIAQDIQKRRTYE